MKQIEQYIESNWELLKKWREEYAEATSESEKQRLLINIQRTEYYIMGLEDARRYIKEERGV